ncbi:hypothetical protein ACTFIV_005886 [Dictyostelium citrinum]
MNPSTLKYNINITAFQFLNGLNTLQLVIYATAQPTSPHDDQCSSNEFGNTTSNDNSNYLQLSVNEHSLYGRFIKRGIVDNNIISIEFIRLDPDFSVLLDQTSASFAMIKEINYQKVQPLVL